MLRKESCVSCFFLICPVSLKMLAEWDTYLSEKPVPSGQHPWRQPKITSLAETLESGYCLIFTALSAGFILPIVIKSTQVSMSHNFK